LFQRLDSLQMYQSFERNLRTCRTAAKAVICDVVWWEYIFNNLAWWEAVIEW